MKVSSVSHRDSYSSSYGGKRSWSLCRQYFAMNEDAVTSPVPRLLHSHLVPQEQEEHLKEREQTWLPTDSDGLGFPIMAIGSFNSKEPEQQKDENLSWRASDGVGFLPRDSVFYKSNPKASRQSAKVFPDHPEHQLSQPLDHLDVKIQQASLSSGPTVDVPWNTDLNDEELHLPEVNPATYETLPVSSCRQHQQKDVQGQYIETACTSSHMSNRRQYEGLDDQSDGSLCQLILEEVSVKLMCSFGGRIMPRPADGRLRYVGGETRIVTVSRGIGYKEFMFKMAQLFGWPLGLKYQLPYEDLDALVSVSSSDDMQNMMEEYEKLKVAGVDFRLRLFFFSSPAEVEVFQHEVTEESCSSLEQRYVDAINGVLEKAHSYHSEDDGTDALKFSGLHHGESSAKPVSYDLVNAKNLSKGPSAPSSLPSSPSVASRQATTTSHGFDNHFQETDQDRPASACGTSYFDREQQYHILTESPRIMNHDILVPRAENWSFTEPGVHFDPQSKLVRQSDQHIDYKTAVGPEQWQDMRPSGELLAPQADSPQYFQQNKQVFRQQQQQAWQLQMDGAIGRVDTPQLCPDVQPLAQTVHQIHYQTSHHHVLPGHDGSSCKSDYHSSPHGYQGSLHSLPPIPHGLSPAPPYQMGSAPSSPRISSHDYHARCTCGHVYSQVHRGITVSIGDQLSSGKRTSQIVDQPTRKHGLPISSRFLDSSSHFGDPSVLQQHSYFTGPVEADHREQLGSVWHAHGKHTSEYHSKSCLCNQADSPVIAETHLPDSSFETNLTGCSCISCHDHGRQQKEVAIVYPLHSGKQDQVAEWVIDGGRHLGPRTNCSKSTFYQDDNTRANYEEKTCIEGDSSLMSSYMPGDYGPRRGLIAHAEGSLQPGKFSTHVAATSRPVGTEELPVSLVLSTLQQEDSEWNKRSSKSSAAVADSWSLASHEPRIWHDIAPSVYVQSPRLSEQRTGTNFVHSGSGLEKYGQSHSAAAGDNLIGEHSLVPISGNRVKGDLSSGPPSPSSFVYEVSEADCVGLKASTANRGGHQLLIPDVISVGSISPAHGAPSISCPWQAIPEVTLSMSSVESSINTLTSPIYDQSPLSSRNNAHFSFGAGEARPVSSEVIVDEEAPTSGMSVTGLLADGMISSILKSCSIEEPYKKESKNAEQRLAGVDSHQVPTNSDSYNRSGDDEAKTGEAYSQVKGSGTATDWLKVGMDKEESLGAVVAGQSVAKVALAEEDKNGELAEVSNEEPKELLLSRAEAEALARDLQIIKNADLEDLKELGSGTFGTVYHGKWRGSDVAIKRIKALFFTGPSSEQEKLLADFWKEACTLEKLHHPNVVAFYGVVPDGPGGTLATVTEYMVNGSLKQVLRKKDRTIDRRKRLFIAMDAAFGMEYLHSKNIVHFDLKCENLLVNMRDAHRPICKVGDFGLSKVKHQTLVSGGVRGTLPWMAPELLSGNCSMVTEKIDIYSFGIVMWELLTGEEPYGNMHCGAIIGGIVNNTLRPSIPTWCDPGWRKLMERCWAGDPAERPSFSEVASDLRGIAATMNLK